MGGADGCAGVYMHHVCSPGTYGGVCACVLQGEGNKALPSVHTGLLVCAKGLGGGVSGKKKRELIIEYTCLAIARLLRLGEWNTDIILCTSKAHMHMNPATTRHGSSR